MLREKILLLWKFYIFILKKPGSYTSILLSENLFISILAGDIVKNKNLIASSLVQSPAACQSLWFPRKLPGGDDGVHLNHHKQHIARLLGLIMLKLNIFLSDIEI